ncbi:hypothetical protein COV20_00595 [Candidatus Woesearchaeota archaeon CG10_big_fil_rev_8_21_14_0_10_45_16]|nr:MAG: hypothetical protein COV20_00595 [Candidatus Woesearchaeota archaeon CG10_big_fil_rev_8_21_14_0_10_45_16]
MKPAISVIIPAHNEENYIRKTLHSLKQQTFQDFETIVVCNGCNDKTEEIVRRRSSARLLSLSNANVSVARNAGALNSTGSVLLFLDADTVLSPETLQKVNEQFNQKYAVATTKVRPDSPQLKYRALMGLKTMMLSTGLFKGFGGTVICRKEDFQAVLGYDPDVTVKEHHQLRKKLQKRGKYLCIDSHSTTSMRRFNSWSIPKAALFWTKQLGRYYLGGDMRKSSYEKVR